MIKNLEISQETLDIIRGGDNQMALQRSLTVLAQVIHQMQGKINEIVAEVNQKAIPQPSKQKK